MLQLFASPAGRALLNNNNRPKGSTSTSSLSREASSRLKSGRRPSGTGTVSAPTSPPRQRKSSAELYKEAVEILGLTCSLTDSCRCIDCQVHSPLVVQYLSVSSHNRVPFHTHHLTLFITEFHWAIYIINIISKKRIDFGTIEEFFYQAREIFKPLS